MTETATATTIQQRAQCHLDNFTRGTRDSETGNGKIWGIVNHTVELVGGNREDHPTVKLSRAGHTDPDGDQMMPEDYRYEFIVDALQLIADAEADQDLDELGYEIEGEIYNTNLTKWLASHLYRASYCDQAVDEYGMERDADTFARLTMGNRFEKQFTYASVLATIREEIDSEE